MSANDQFDPSRAVPLNSAPSNKTDDDFNPDRAVRLNADNALVRGWKSMSNSVGITKDLAKGDAAAVARRVKEFDDYSRANPGSQQGQELSKAWEQGDGITGGIKGVAGEIAKDWKEAPNWVGGIRSVAGNAKAMGEGLVAQIPNMLAPMAGMVGGGLAGAAAGSAVPVVGNVAGGIAGAWAGASAGNAMVEGGGMLMDRLNKAGINPQDTAAVEKLAREQGDAALGEAAIKGGIIGAVDTATAGLGGRILNAPARAAADRALAQMGVNMADDAAVKAAKKSDAFKQLVMNDAAYKAASSGAGNVARNVGVAALDPAGEFAGEFVGQGVATGDWDTKNAALEAISSMGQSAIMYGGQKAYQAATSPLRGKGQAGAVGDEAGDAKDEAPKPLLLENNPGTMVVFPDGTVGREREIDNYLANLPEDQRAEARAKLFRKTIKEVNDPKVQRWWENYAEGQPPTATVDHLAAVQAAVRNGTGFSTAQTVDTVRNAMEDAWLEANVRNEPDSAVQLASDAGQQLGGQMAQFSEELSAATAAVDAQLRTTRILSGLQNAMDSGAMGSAASINYVNDALTRIGEQPMAQDEMARATRLLDAHAAFTGQTTPAPLPGDLASQNPLVDRYADNSAMESLIRRPMSERMGVDPSKGGISKAAAMAVDSVAADEAASAAQLPGATQPLGMQNPLLAPMANNAMAPVESAFNINGAINGTEANQTQQGFAQSAQAGPAQAGENAAAAVSQATGIQQAGATPGPAAQGLTDGSSTAINNGAQAQSQNAAQGQKAATQSASQSGAAAGGNVVSASNAGASEFDAAREAIKLEANQTTSDPMTIGSTPKTGDAVSVRDGVVYLGKYEALDYDSGEPITVPPGATRGQVAQALRAGGVLTDRQKVFGLNGRENESIEGPSPATTTAPVPAQVQAAAPEKAQATAPVAPAATTAPAGPAAQATNPKQRKAIDRIHSEKGAFFFSKPKAEDFLADNGLQDQYEVVQKEKAFVIQARKAQSATENVADDGADQTPIKQAASDPIAGRDLGDGWAEFTPESGTKAVPRAEMPQIKAEHRGAMVNFMNARGVTHEEESVPAASLKPTQREFSRDKVEKAKAFTGGNRAILTSSDGHVLDGHHQWLAARDNGEDVRTIRLNAPIDQLVKLAHDFPSSTVADGAKAGETSAASSVPESATLSNADFIKALEQHRKELPEGFEITPMGETISLKENGKFAVNGLSRNRAGVEEALRLAKKRDAENKAASASTAPEHAQVGVDERELSEIVGEFKQAHDSMVQDEERVHHLFDEPTKKDIVRLADKVKVYTKDNGWMTVAEAKAEVAKWKAHAKAQKATRQNSDKVVLSLFDYTGKWSQPWEEAGYQVYRFDIQNDPEAGDVHNFSTEFFADWFGDFDGQDIYAVLAACPCTDFASSGARHFAAKDADGRTVASVKLVQQTLNTIEHFKPAVWAIENPVGRIEKLGSLPPWRLSFDPNHIGDPYTKKTLLWGRFNGDMPIAPVEPTEGSKMHSQYGGKSLATKNARSATPEGFAYGFFMANNAIDNPVMALANKFDRLDRDLIAKALSVGVTADAITSAVEDFYYMDLDDAAANNAIRALIPKDSTKKNADVTDVTSKEKPATTQSGARSMNADGSPVDGKPLMPNDRFEMVSGRVTTPFPIAKGDLAMQRWLALNALNEAKANGDDFNGTMFQSMVDGLAPSKQKERRALSPADMDALNMFLWEVQPEAVPSILKPLTGSGIALPGKLDSKGFDAWIAKNGSEHPYQFLAKGERGDNGVGMITLSGEIEQQGANWAGNARGPKDNRDQRNVFRLNDGKLVYWDADTGLTLAVSPDDKRLEITKQEPEAKEQLNPTEIAFDMNDEHYSIFFDQPLENLSEQEFEDELYTRGYPSAVQDRFRDEYKKAQTRNESKGTAKPRLGETANKVWSEIRRLNTEGIHYPGQGLLHPVMEVVGGDWFMLDSNSRLKLVDRGAASLSYSEPTDAQTAEFHDALNKDQIQVRLMSRAGYKSGYKQPSTLQVLHSPSGNSFGVQAPEVSVIAKIKARNEEAERAEREAAVKKAAEREARQASREVERDLFRHLTSSTGGLAGKPLEQVTEAIKAQLASRDATTAINPVQISRLARAIHKHLQANSKKLDKDAARDPAAKAAAIDQGLASYGEVILPEQIDGFVLGFEHALSGKTKSTLSGEGLPDMLKGYEAATDWIDTDAGAAWFEGKRRKKLENTGVDLRRHWEAMKAQMKAGETDVQKVWKQIEAATNRAELFSPYLPEGAAPGWVAYVTQLRASTKTFKQFLFDGNYRWIGSSAWGRKGKDAANLEFVLEGKRYPADMSEEQRAQWKTDQVFRVQQLRDAAELYIEKVQKLTAFLDGLSSVKDASERFVETMVAENYQAKARDKNVYFSRYEHIHDKTMEEVIRGGRAGVFDKGVWGGDSVDFAKFRAASAWTETLIEKQDTLALPTRATPLTPPKLDRVERAMPKDHRGGKDVTPEQFKDKFGFADVGFGNWVGAKNDQDHLNYAYDAFMDLAEHFGFAPKNIGLGGALHFTVGALGHGKFAAHFSPNHPGPNGAVQVINLTNTKGDGTVYHEWSHALDHNLGGEWKAVRRTILNALQYKAYEASDWERIARNFLVGGSYWKGNKNQDKVDAAIKGLTYYAAQGSRRGQTAYKENADKLGKDYWGNEAELFARATEAWAADSLGGINSYLVNKDWVGDGKVTQAAGFRGTPYPTGGERALFGKYMTALAKSVKFIEGKPSVTLDDFEKNLPEDMGAGEARRQELLTKDGMQAYYEQILEERAMAAEEKARREREKEAEEKAKADALAAEALAELAALSKPSVLDTPPASSTPGPLTEDDLSSIFDEAAAELREENQEKPEAPAPGETAKPVADSSGKPNAEDAKHLQKLVEDGSMVLFSGTDWAKKNGLPSIHSFQSMPGEVRHMGYGVFDYISPEFSGTYTGGGAMEKTEGGIAYTTFGVTKGRWDYPKARVLEALKALSEKTEAVAPKAAGKEASASTKAPAPAEDKNAAKLIAEAAKLGVTGANEALSGLAKLFGGGKGGRLNSFPAGFDEETYKAAKPHFKAALTAFQEAGKTLKDLFKLLIQNFGDGVKDYAIQFAKDEGLTAQLGKAPAAGEQRSPSGVLANWVKAQLERGEADGSFDWRALFEQADAAFGGTQAEGKYTPKDAYDAMEAGVNQFILSRPAEFNPNASADAAHIVVERLHRLTQMLPTQTKRTAEQDEFQQFSTVPALAYAANWAANMDSTDTMMEPSAGIGGLAAFAKNAGVKLILNELSSRRAAVLREVFPAAKVYTENAEQIDNILPESEIPSVVVMNPPFSATAGRIQGKRDTHVGALHVEQGLKRLADGGRLVAIVGEGMNLDRPAFSAWWKEIRAKYDVRAVIPMDGSGYAKYGTTYDNAILVIDKVKPSGRPIVTTPAKTYSELIGSLAEIRNDRPESVFPSNDTDGFELNAAEQALAEPAQAGERVSQPEQSGRDDGADVGRAESGRGQGVGSGGGRSGRAGGSGRAGVDGAKSGAGRGAGRNDAGGSGDAAAAGGGGSDATESAVSIQAADQVADPAAGLTDAIFESYQPQRLQVPGAKPHPGPLVQSSAMAAVLPPVPTYTPNLPKETIEKGLLSIAQIEAVVYAGQAHQELLEPITVDGKDVAYRRGFFIGDGTGVGKGREISGIILDNLRQGREKAVWISEKPGLLADAQRDFSGIGGDPKQIFNVSKTKAEEQINADKGIAFLSYATLRSGAKSQEATVTPTTKAQFAKQFPKGLKVVAANGRGTYTLDHIDPKDGGKVWVDVDGQLKFMRFSMVESIDGQSDWQSGRSAAQTKGGKKEGQSRLDQLVNWLGKDFDGVIAFDEAHNAGNAVAQKANRGQSQPSAQALAVVELQKRLPNARVVYVSATGATQVSNLSFATRLGLWGPSTPFASVQNFIAEMTAGGLAAMELVARDLKQMGAYMARSLSFEGVTYSRVEHQLSPLQQDIYNRLAEAWQVTLQNIDAALEKTGAVGGNGKGSSSAKSAAMSAYWGAQQRFFSQVITSMQMPSVLEQMERDIAEGKALVLQLVNTNEAQQNRSIAKRRDEDESADLEELDLTPRDVLIQMVEKSFPVTQFEEQEDDSGKKIRVPAKDSEGNPVINREAVAMRDALLKDLKDIRVPDGPLEIVLNHFGVDKVAEVTGRTQRVVRKQDKDGEIKAQLESRGPASARADANAFMADQKQILVFSDAGGTGYSFHADNTQKNKRKRAHYLIQPGWRADKAVQGFGRTHRTNQASAPHYYLASTNVPAQKRFLSAIARRLDQLGALTKGQRDTANQGMFSEKDNLESIYASQAVQQFFKDGQHQQLDGISFSEYLRQTGLEGIIDEETNRIAEDRIPDTRTFLNRMLSLKLDMQEKVFDAFMLRMEEKVEMAVERGEFDAGLQTIRALETRVVADDLAYTDPRSGAETRLVELELTHPTTIYPFPHYLLKADYVVNEKSGKVYAKTMVGKATTKDGAVVDRYRFHGTGSVQSKTAPEVAKGYRPISKAEAIELWAAENEARPKTYTERKHMIVGAMLPIWDRLKTDTSIQVARTMTVDGSRLLGRLIDKKSLPEVRKRLNVASAASKMKPAEVMAQILKGDKAELANGWTLERARVSDDLRIELKNPNGGYFSPAVVADMVGMGVVRESISWKDRFFVPTGAAGVPVLERLTKTRPVVELQSEQESNANYAGAAQRRPASAQDKAVMQAIADGKSARDVLRVVASGSKDPFLRQVARMLLKTGITPNIEFGHIGLHKGNPIHGQYRGKTDTIAIAGSAEYAAERIFMHEAMHAATMRALAKPGLARLQLQKLAAHVRKQPGAAGFYGISDKNGKVDEFVAEVFTNPDFQAALRKMKAPSESSAIKTAWDGFVRILRSILGLPNDSNNALSQALQLGVAAMREDMALRKSAKNERSMAVSDREFLDGNPVASMRGDEVPRLGGQALLVNWAAKHFEKSTNNGVVTHPEIGEIKLDRRSAKDSLSHGYGKDKIQALYLLPEVLPKAKVLHTESRKEGQTGYVLGAPVEIGGKAYVAAMVVTQHEGRTGLYVHEVVLKEKLQGAINTGAPVQNQGDAQSSRGNPGAIRSVLERIYAVNPDDQVANFGMDDATAAAKNIGQGLKAITATDVKKAGSHKLTDWLKIGLQFLGRRQLVDIYGDIIPMAEYDRLVAQMEADKNDVGAEADNLATRWGKLKDDVQLSELMHDATLAEIDADSSKEYVEGDNKPRSAALKRRFDALTPEAQAVYREARDHYREHHKQVRSAIRDRIMRAELSSKKREELLKKMDADFFGYVKGVYFPLARFGQYVVATKDEDGKVISVSRAETMTEAERMREEMRKAFPADKGFSVGRVTLSKDFVATHDMVGRGFMSEVFAALDKQDIPAEQRAELEDTLGQLYLSSLPDLSWAKHGIHRKGTPGFSQDARRAFAQNSFHGARYLAKLKYSDLMANELDYMQKHVDTMGAAKADFDQPKAQRVVDEMQKRHDQLMNPKTNSLSTALTSFGFIFHLGLSPAAAMVNLSQTALVAYPVMGAKWGFKKSAEALLRASNESVKGKNDIRTQLKDKDELDAYDEAVRAGVIDVTMAHDLAGIAQGEDAGVMWKLQPVMRAASFLFHHAERFNRQATFIAAYRLSREAGTEHHKAYEEAVKATYDGHFDYGSANRPRLMQGNVARVVLLFKQFAQNMIYTLGRNAYLASKGDKQAMKTFAGLITMHAAGAGVLGLPLVGPLLALASALGGDDDEPWDAEVALRNMLADVFGQKTSEVIAKGFSRLTPWDISGRIGLDNLIFPDIREGLEGKMWAQEMAVGLLGPVVGIGINAARGAQLLSEGDFMRGLENMMPVVPRNAIKSARFLQEGAKDSTGITIKDEVGGLGILGQLVGFSPSEVRLAFEGRSAVMNADRRLNVRRSELLSEFAHAVMKKDVDAQAKAKDSIKTFNEKNPGRRITNPQMWQSVRSRQRRIDQAEDGVYLPRNRRDAMGEGGFAF